MKRSFAVAALIVTGAVVLVHPLAAQQQGGNNNNQNDGAKRIKPPFPLWKAELPGGNYIVARNAINAISSQQYVLDGVARVTEVNITTSGNFHPRFYYLEMLSSSTAAANLPGAALVADQAKLMAQTAGEQLAPEVWSKVVKNYPATTHASTIEYRLDTADQLQKLYESVERVWLTGESEVYTPKGIKSYNPQDEIKDVSDDNGNGGPGTGGGAGNN